MALSNTWHHRKVAPNAQKPCWICFKSTSSVLITPDNKDFFYTCLGHLSDRGFCTPDADEAAAAAARAKKQDLEREIEAVKKEYEDRQKAKQEKGKGVKKGKERDKEDEADEKKTKKEEEGDERDEKAKDEKIKALAKSKDSIPDEGPRIFTLAKSFYQQRLDRIRNAEISRRNRERLTDVSNFPKPPSGNP